MKKRGEGRERLIDAARREFEEHGYEGTHTNAIAKRAGYAPQTFYRHFEDKLAIFLAVYEAWTEEEAAALARAKTIAAMADAILQRHRTHRIFRRSLRTLTVTEPEVGQARARARRIQMGLLGELSGNRSPAQLLAGIFTIERLCDAIVEGEFGACGISRAKARAEFVRILTGLTARS
jgi:AcrR family transcriptional regulator